MKVSWLFGVVTCWGTLRTSWKKILGRCVITATYLVAMNGAINSDPRCNQQRSSVQSTAILDAINSDPRCNQQRSSVQSTAILCRSVRSTTDVMTVRIHIFSSTPIFVIISHLKAGIGLSSMSGAFSDCFFKVLFCVFLHIMWVVYLPNNYQDVFSDRHYSQGLQRTLRS